INGWWCDQMAAQGFYRYDRANYLGPLHFYVLRLFLTLFGRNLCALRLPTVLMGIASVGLTFLFSRFFGWRATYLPALALAVSPVPKPPPWAHVGPAVAVALALIVFFYSGNFLNWSGVTGLYRTFSHWASTGVGAQSGHEKPDYDISMVPHFLRHIPAFVSLA